jgi:hypothetical protein
MERPRQQTPDELPALGHVLRGDIEGELLHPASAALICDWMPTVAAGSGSYRHSISMARHAAGSRCH